LNPLTLPNNVVIVLFRPFLWEAHSGLQLIAALETAAVTGLVVVRRRSILIAFQRSRRWPFLLYCWILLILYSMTFASFGNFGLLNRQRSLVLPALYALIAIDPFLARRQDELDHEKQAALERR
jgi:hypothetical protein